MQIPALVSDKKCPKSTHPTKHSYHFSVNELDFAPDASLDVSQLAGGVSKQRFWRLVTGQEPDLPEGQGHGHLRLNQRESHAHARAGALKIGVVVYRIVL